MKRNRSPPFRVVIFMAKSGSTMGEDPTWGELLLGFALAAAVPVVIGGTLLVSLVGLTVWATAPLRRRRRSPTKSPCRATDSGHDVTARLG